MAKQPRGRCAFCGHETAKGSMGRHLAACPGRQDQIASGPAIGPQTLIHLRMQDADGGAFWFDAEVRGSATLADIDSYLRAIWLECCGHLSRFSLGGWGGREMSMRRRVDAVFADGVELTHIYDFGTQSVTQVRAVGSREAVPLGPRPMVLMARNLAPEVVCIECDQPATHLCEECQLDWDSPGVLCAQHAKVHPHEEYGQPIEIVNSPRLGLCGYTGPADPPY
jgi:hypothetical protein